MARQVWRFILVLGYEQDVFGGDVDVDQQRERCVMAENFDECGFWSRPGKSWRISSLETVQPNVLRCARRSRHHITAL
jgi:hypothetical protein